jgi:hypothetical protein
LGGLAALAAAGLGAILLRNVHASSQTGDPGNEAG